MEDQLLETYKYAAEEMRSLREHEWTVTNYTVIAYGALAGIPWVASKALPNAERWRTSVSVFAVVVVLFVEYQALRTHYGSQASDTI